MLAKATIQLFTFLIYVLILITFNRARMEYSGGKIGQVLKLILITVVLLFMADYVLFFDAFFSPDILQTINILLKTIGLSFLALGGARLLERK